MACIVISQPAEMTNVTGHHHMLYVRVACHLQYKLYRLLVLYTLFLYGISRALVTFKHHASQHLVIPLGSKFLMFLKASTFQ